MVNGLHLIATFIPIDMLMGLHKNTALFYDQFAEKNLQCVLITFFKKNMIVK